MTALTRRRRLLSAAATIALVFPQACLTLHRPSFMVEPAERNWPVTLAAARRRVSEGRVGAADTLLANFAVEYPGTPEATESIFWRGVMELDPTNHTATTAHALSLLDTYISQAPDGEHKLEAVTLRRVAGQLEGLTKLAAAAMTHAEDANAAVANANARAAEARADAAKPTDTSSQDAEIKRLRDELAKANAELERIRRRLAQPPT